LAYELLVYKTNICTSDIHTNTVLFTPTCFRGTAPSAAKRYTYI